MNTPQQLLDRLDAIGLSLQRSGHALALLGLGSVGSELDRLDEYSDLDFFAIVAAGCKQQYLESLDWLGATAPIAYQFRNTVDGYKVLFVDGIFCEFAVFEPAELKAIPFARGRIVWQREDFDAALAQPERAAPRAAASREWLVGEALTNLYVGLGRYWRGEKISALRFIQQYAVDHVLALAAELGPPTSAPNDVFVAERRFEQRFPAMAAQLPAMMQGYDGSCASAEAVLDFLEQHFAVNPALAQAIRHLALPRG
jgi:hypothetical protein